MTTPSCNERPLYKGVSKLPGLAESCAHQNCNLQQMKSTEHLLPPEVSFSSQAFEHLGLNMLRSQELLASQGLRPVLQAMRNGSARSRVVKRYQEFIWIRPSAQSSSAGAVPAEFMTNSSQPFFHLEQAKSKTSSGYESDLSLRLIAVGLPCFRKRLWNRGNALS